MTNFQKIIRKIIDEDDLRQVGVAEKLGYTDAYISNFATGIRPISKNVAKKLEEVYGYDAHELMRIRKLEDAGISSETQILEEPKTLYQSKKPEPQKFSEKTFKKEVTVIPAKAQLGLQSFLYPDEMMNDLETKIILVDQDYKGKYYEIECVGDSMDDGSSQSIKNGDSVLCREISKLHWKNKFHKNDWEFVFFHNEHGIIIKSIKDQNLENGDLILRSYNPDKEEYPDFQINIKDCFAICNVVQVTQNRKKYFTL